ncbi:unnamed protein product [Brachionus calyciflorus]|uniref:Uncharacterized protein n=1 Tax=Brachionus calyciflorus TaxID=104777 RepID=A0A814DIN2_9BILA|nr:unnamed protein product [Brachionus calyciflorus]
MSRKINFLKIFLILISINLWTIECSDLICANAFNKEERNYEIVNCKFNSQGKIFTVDYQCKVYLNKNLETSNTQNIVEADFRLKDQVINQKEATFYWRSFKEHSHSTHYHRSENEFKNIAKINFTLNESKNISKASVILYKIHYETVYEVCVNVEGLFSQEDKVCCSVENKEEEEESNIFMVLIVLGILLLIYVYVVIASWKTSKSEKTLDDMLETLPTAHVERLKSLFIAADDEEIDDDNDDDLINDENKLEEHEHIQTELFVKNNKKGKSAKRVMIKENPAYEPDDEGEVIHRKINVKNEEEIDDIEFNLYREAQKFRKMSRMSVAAIPKEDLKRLKENRQAKSVKFSEKDDSNTHIDELDMLRLKVYNESKRRASIKPFKKAYDLDVTDSD